MNTGIDYCIANAVTNFELTEFFSLFWNEPGSRRSIYKNYEIVVFALFSALVEVLGITI